MLKKIRFYLTPAVVESGNAQTFLRTLASENMEYILCPSHAPDSVSAAAKHSSKTTTIFDSPEDCLVITDSASGIAFARAANLPCVGYAPPGSSENLSGAYALFEDFASVDTDYFRRTHAHAIGSPANILTTERLIVREFSEEDFPTLYAMCTEPSVASFMQECLSDYNTEQEKHNAYIRTVYPFFDLALWGIYEKSSRKLIGRAGFSLPDEDDHTFSIGYLIDVPYRKQGFAKELIPALLSYAKVQGYTETSARIKKENIASVKVLEQCGFPYERRSETTEEMIRYLIHLTV